MNSNYRSFAVVLVATAIALSACTTVKLAAESGPGPRADADCKFATDDLRPNPALLIARMSNRAKAVDVDPPLAREIRDRVCKALGESARNVSAAFVVTDYECIVSGFFTSKFIVEVRGRLISRSGAQYDLRQAAEYSSGSGFIPTGCQSATLQVLDGLVPKLASTILRLPTPSSNASST